MFISSELIEVALQPSGFDKANRRPQEEIKNSDSVTYMRQQSCAGHLHEFRARATIGKRRLKDTGNFRAVRLSQAAKRVFRCAVGSGTPRPLYVHQWSSRSRPPRNVFASSVHTAPKCAVLYSHGDRFESTNECTTICFTQPHDRTEILFSKVIIVCL